MLRNFIKYVPEDTRDQFATYGWGGATLAFAEAVKATVDKGGALTRANFLKNGVTSLHKFNAGGMMGTVDIAGRVPTDCSLVLQLKNRKYVRVFPKKKGTFDCKPSNLSTVEADLVGS